MQTSYFGKIRETEQLLEKHPMPRSSIQASLVRKSETALNGDVRLRRRKSHEEESRPLHESKRKDTWEAT